MKKLKLLFAVLALLGGAISASAQASYNHTYTAGVEVAAGGDYFLYNIGAGQFLTSGLNYGTRATVDNSGRVLTLSANGTGFNIKTEHVSLNDRTDGKVGYLTTNGYVDTGSSDAAWVFTSVSVPGYTNAYTIKNSDTQYLYYDTATGDFQCAVNVGNSTENNNSYWLLIPKSARESIGDYSHYLINTQMNAAWELKTWSGSTGNNSDVIAVGGNTANRCAEKYHVIKDIYQNIKETVPNGRYRVYAQGFWRQDGSSAGPVFYANSDTKTLMTRTGSENSMTDASNSFSEGKYVNSVETFVNDGKLKVGINITAGDQWVIFDNVVLDYLGQLVKDYAVELPTGGAMEANKWYYFDIDAAADNYNATATALGNIICTDDGNTSASAATGNVTLTATDNNFAAKRYYVKSSTANNLEIGVASYTYTVSEASVDKTYIQPSQTVTVSFTANTNDTGATLDQDYSGVTFDEAQINVTPGASGFTFTVPANLTANTEHTLYIPAGAIGYNEGTTYNAEQSITLKTPAVFDGTYFLKVAATYDGSSEGTSAAVGKYMARGTAYSTHLSLDSYGLPVAITTDGSNQTILKMADTNGYVYSTGSYDAYADGSDAQKTNFSISIQNSKYLIASNNRDGKYLKYNTANAGDEEISVFDDGTGKNSGPIIMWAVESISEHATAMQAKKNTQAANAAAAAYASGNYESLNGITTVAALESELTTNYIEGAFVTPSEITSVEESYQPRNNSSANLVPITVYSNKINITAAGFYKFSMQAFNRATWNENVQAMHGIGADMPAAVLFFGDSETQIKSLYDEDGHDTAVEGANPADASYNGKYYANCKASALKMFKDDKYHNDVWFYCATPGEYTYGVKVMGYASGQWFIYSPQSVTITSYAAAATAADYTALETAINAYDNADWGFETGEYAPYNNLEAINNIAAAKAIDKEAENSKLLVNSLTTKITLNANAEEVNAVYWKTDYTADDKAADTYVHPIGWTNTGYNTRIMCAANDAAENAAMTTIGTAVFSKYNTTYGETAGYTMPLKAGKIYKITFKYCGWGNNPTTNVVLTDPESNAITLAPGFKPATNDGNKNADHWYDYTGYFVSTTAGNYVLAMNKVDDGQQQIAWANMQIVSASELEFADNSAVPTYAPGTYPRVKITRTLTANKWATAVYPFAVSGVDNIAVLNSYNSTTGELGFTSATESTANEPFLMRSTAGTTEITLSNVEVAAASAEDATSGDASLKGAYSTTNITNAEKNYVLSNNQIFSVGDAGATINPYRAYIQIAEDVATPARALRFVVDGQITGVDNVAAEASAEVKDGKYLENGKIVVVKNGKKFNAAGAQMK